MSRPRNSRAGARFVLLAALLGTACVSVADRPGLPPEIVARIEAAPSPHFRAHLDCEPNQVEYAVSCEKTLAEVKRVLSASPWFDTVEADRDDASLLLSIQPMERSPYWHGPAHSPGGLLLMAVLPLPSKLL